MNLLDSVRKALEDISDYQRELYFNDRHEQADVLDYPILKLERITKAYGGDSYE